MSETSNKAHVAVLPFPFSSHPNTLMALLLKMATSAPQIHFSFFSTKKSNLSLFSSSNLADQLPVNINIYDVDDGVPTNHKFTSNHHHEPFDLFLNVAQENITRRIETVAVERGIKVTCVVSDAFLTFAGQIAQKFGASWVPVWTGLPSCLYSYLHIQVIKRRFADDSVDIGDRTLEFIPGLSMMRVKDLPPAILAVDAQKSLFAKSLSRIGEELPKATAVAVSSFEELNPEPLNNGLKSISNNFLNLGIVALPSTSDPEGCLSWLDGKSSKSVAYISFGTLAELPDKELQALAEALECSKTPFLWSLKDNLREKLPNGFVERTSQQGKMVPWAPQLLVLGHSSIGVFISHSGYNAVRESIVNAVPMICRPFFGDQMMAARLVEVAWGVGVMFEDGKISKNALVQNLELFLSENGEKRNKMRENVEQLNKAISMATQPGGSAFRDFNKLMEIISMV